MKRKLTALMAGMALVCTLSACGGGGGTPTPDTPVATAATPAAKTRITIYLDGDSTNHGVDADYASGMTLDTPAMRMQADFDAALPGQVTVIDGSISGNSFPDDLQTGGPVTVPLATRLAQLPTPANIVITNSEINDQYTLGETTDQYVEWIKQWISTVRASNATPILEQPNPVCSPGSNIPVSDQFVDGMDATSAAASVYVLPEYSAFKAYPEWCGTLLGKDGIHPSDAGYAFKESQYFAALLPVVAKMAAQAS
jgi:lysophospholipase L1-like esterase